MAGRVDPEVARALEALVAKTGETRSSIIEEALRREFKRRTKKPRPE